MKHVIFMCLLMYDLCVLYIDYSFLNKVNNLETYSRYKYIKIWCLYHNFQAIIITLIHVNVAFFCFFMFVLLSCLITIFLTHTYKLQFCICSKTFILQLL